jgi:hypothetical protein
MGYSKYTINRAIFYEGVAPCVMSLVCSKALGSPNLSQSLTMLTTFDIHFFHPHSILPAFPIQLGGKMVEVDGKVVDVPLDYNMLLGCNWTYTMTVVISYVLHTLWVPHDGKIMMIDHLSFAYVSPSASVQLSIPVVNNSQPTIENISVKMYSSLMGTFNFMALIHHVYAMSSRLISSKRFVPFHTSYFKDPWTLPSLNAYYEGRSHVVMVMPLSATEIVYQDALDSFVDPDPITS